jgi:hypothetical protein
MALYKVDSDTAELTKVAGGTLYADLPIGSWIKNDMDTIPSGFLKEGDTISATECPELYAKYGSTVPYKADKSELSEYEEITLPTSSATAMTMDYDGELFINMFLPSDGQYKYMYINGVAFNIGVASSTSGGGGCSNCIPFKKGDVIYSGGTLRESKVAYYKKSLIVKAKQVAVPFDMAEYIRKQNVLSEWEDITLPTSVETAITMQYDGIICATLKGKAGNTFDIYVNGIPLYSSVSRDTVTVPFKKGDTVYCVLTGSTTETNYVRYYKLRDYTGR